MGKLALVRPAGTVTVEGTTISGLLLDSTITAPPDGAAADSVTMPVSTAGVWNHLLFGDNPDIVTSAWAAAAQRAAKQSAASSASQKRFFPMCSLPLKLNGGRLSGKLP